MIFRVFVGGVLVRNYSLRWSKYHLIEIIRPLVEVRWGVSCQELLLHPALGDVQSQTLTITFHSELYVLRGARKGATSLLEGCLVSYKKF